MDELWDRLEALTVQTVSRLPRLSEEELLEFVNEREILIDRIKDSITEMYTKSSYQERAKRLLQYDEVVIQRMQWFQQQNNKEMFKINAAKRQNSAYDAELRMDSVLFDKRK